MIRKLIYKMFRKLIYKMGALNEKRCNILVLYIVKWKAD
jgi:hypothetical protein